MSAWIFSVQIEDSGENRERRAACPWIVEGLEVYLSNVVPSRSLGAREGVRDGCQGGIMLQSALVVMECRGEESQVSAHKER